MKRKSIRKQFIKTEVKESIKQRPQTYHNLPKRTKLASIRYVDDQVNRYCKNETYIKNRKK